MPDVVYANHPILNFAAQKSELAPLINFQTLSKNESTTPIMHPDATELPVVDPDAAMAGALAGTGADGVTREELTLDALTITAKLRARHVLIKRTVVEDARDNPDGVNVTEAVNLRAGVIYANAITAEVKTALSATTTSVEYTDDAHVDDDLEALLEGLESQDIDPTHWVMPKKMRAKIRAVKDTTGQYIIADVKAGTPDILHGLPVVWTSNSLFSATEFGFLAAKPYIHAGVRLASKIEPLKELYAGSDSIGYNVRARFGVTVLQHAGTITPCAKWINAA